MALTIVVRSGEAESPPTVTFDAPRIVIGRGEGCDVRLPDPSVSHRHASLRQRGAEYLVLDEGSTNGTYVGQVRLSPQAPRVVRSGEQIRIGRVWLEVRIEHVAPTVHPQVVTQEIALALVASALRADGELAAPRVQVREGPDAGREVVLNDFDQPYLVGRASGAALSLSDDDASRHHVELRRRGGRVFVRDLGSKNGSQLGEQDLKRDELTLWPAEATLRVGQNQLGYEDPVAGVLVELEGMADEHMREDESVEPPAAEVSPSDAPTSATPPPAAATPKRRETGPKPVPAAPRRPSAGGWGTTDLLVALLALVVLALSIVGIWWLLGP